MLYAGVIAWYQLNMFMLEVYREGYSLGMS